jgi:cytoskeletal protein CcmA (bactofilin family)
MKNKVRRFLAGSVLLGTVLTAGTTFAATPKVNERLKVKAPLVIGTVSTVNGNTLIVTPKIKRKNSTTVPYTVDATNAKLMKDGTSTTISNIAIGDTVMIKGKINGTNITATSIRDKQLSKGIKSKKVKKNS